jgi:N-acyl-D-aspartate/D-glutamate deacylase
MPSFSGDVGISGGKVVEVGKLRGPAHRVIDVQGQAIAPGFIDSHCHFDAQVLWDPLCTFACYHGVTTVINGNCSLALAPAKAEDRYALVSMLSRVGAIPMASLQAGIEGSWESIGDYLDVLDQRLGVNVGQLVGYSAVRRYVMGDDAYTEPATVNQIERMKAVIREGIAVGALGLSFERTTLHMDAEGRPLPCNVASNEELLAVVDALADVGAGYIQFGGGLDLELEEGLLSRMAQASGRPITTRIHEDTGGILAHLEASWRAGLRILPGIRSLIDETSRWTLMNVVGFDRLPNWRALTLRTPEERRRGFLDSANRDALRADTETDMQRPQWDTTCVASAALVKNRSLVGRSISDIAAEQGRPPLDAFLDLAIEEDLATVFYERTDVGPELIAPVVTSPYTMPGQTDSGALITRRCDSHVPTHLLSTWVRDMEALTLEEAVRKLSSVPASILGLHDRGLIRPGLAADLVVFDPDSVSPGDMDEVVDFPAGAARMRRLPHGIECTIVNGEVLIQEGEHTGAYPGRVARSGASSAH